MQSKLRFSSLFAIIALLFLISCSKKNKSARYIPDNAGMVMHVNGETINSKLPWSEVKQNSLFQELYSDTSMNAVVKSALENPESTGIDVKNDIYFFVTRDSIGGYAALQGTVKDADKFKTFFANTFKSAPVTDKDNISSYTNDKMIATWNKEHFTIVFDAPEMNEMNAKNIPMPSMSEVDTAIIQPTVPVIKRNLGAVTAQIFALKEDNSILKDKRFTDLMDTKGDMHLWINVNALNIGNMDMGPLSRININKVYDSSAFAATATFMDGKINIDAKSYANKEMSDLFKQNSGTKISTDMINRLPAKEVDFLFSMNFKPEGILAFLKILGLDGMANLGTAQLGFTLDDFIKANKGDILLAVSDIQKDTAGKTSADILFSASVKDKAAFNKLIEAGKTLGKRMFTSESPIVFYNMNDNLFAIGSNKETVDKYILSANNSNYAFLKDLSDDPLAIYINFQHLIKASEVQGSDSLKMQTYDASLKMWDNFIASGGKFKDGGIVQHAEINLVDKKTNSLKQLNTYLGTMGAIEKKKKERNKSNWGSDTTITVDSVSPVQ